MRTLLAVLALLSLAYGIVGGFILDAERQGRLMWDLDYYRAAAERWSAGQDPYLENGRATGYYYSLAVTPLLARTFHGFAAERSYAAVGWIAIAAALALAIRAVRPPPGATPLCWLYAVAFGNAEAVYVAASGNLAWLAGLLQAGALVSAARGGWTLFYALVGLSALIKPYALLLLLVPLALRAASWRASIAVLPLALDAALAWGLWPELAASRSRAIWLGVVEPLQLRYSLAGRLSRVLADLGLEVAAATLVAVAVQLAVAAALVAVLRARPPADGRRALALAVVAAFAALPRMAGYDAFVFGPAVLVAFLPVAGEPAPRPATALAWVTLVVGLLKEGLALVGLAGLAALRASRRETTW